MKLSKEIERKLINIPYKVNSALVGTVRVGRIFLVGKYTIGFWGHCDDGTKVRLYIGKNVEEDIRMYNWAKWSIQFNADKMEFENGIKVYRVFDFNPLAFIDKDSPFKIPSSYLEEAENNGDYIENITIKNEVFEIPVKR